MLKTTGFSEDLALNMFGANSNKVVGGIGSDRANEIAKNSSKSKKLKNKKSENLTYIRAIKKPIFLISCTKKAFNCLKQVFIEAPILRHFDLESHI